ncbi:MAG: hypothetical protein EHM88_22325 [Candidatus Rokuibacteriota bacterium]|nr:MAG: hypothetical protein EHM88_22325 [Candidatus Rokubacteria bacterium]
MHRPPGLALESWQAELRPRRWGPAAGLEAVHDETTGERYLKLRLPSPEVIGEALRAVRALLQGSPG